MNKEELIPRLVTEFGYPHQGARIVSDKLVIASHQIKDVYTEFLETGAVPTI
jgi:hypothetical protein